MADSEIRAHATTRRRLTAAGGEGCGRHGTDLHTARGIAIREFEPVSRRHVSGYLRESGENEGDAPRVATGTRGRR